MNRRSFLKNTSLLGAPILVNGFGVDALNSGILAHAVGETDKVLVLIQLNGGNDGINTLIPLDQYDHLSSLRANILIPENQVLNIEDNLGLHPEMSGVKSLFDDGKIKFVQGVAYPNQNRSHFRSTDIWTSGSGADEQKSTGWLGSYFDQNFPGYPENYPDEQNPDPFALTVGSIVSETCQGLGGNFSLAIRDPFSLSSLGETEQADIPNTNYGEELRFLINSIKQTNEYGETITAAAEVGTNLSDKYPDDNALAQQLKTVALLISGGLQTNVYVVQLGGFDTHAAQTEASDSSAGVHAQLLSQLSVAIDAFQDDLEKQNLEERVLGMTFSEFGRQIKSNDGFGTDHGTAAPMILFGSCVDAGVLGQNPDFGGEILDQEGVPMQYDFRSVYASVLIDWFGVNRVEVENIFHPEVQQLTLLSDSCLNATSVFGTDPFIQQMIVFPNPTKDHAKVVVGVSADRYRMSIFNHLGQEIKVITNEYLQTGTHTFHIPMMDLIAGSYIIRLAGANTQMIKKLIKM